MKIKVEIFSTKMVLSNDFDTITVVPEKPYHSKRLVIAQFSAARECLSRGIKMLGGSATFLRPAPTLIIHQRDVLEGGISEVEQHCLRELALAAGAREVEVVLK